MVDRQAFTQPDQLHLTGWVGSRVEANEANRLVKIDVDRTVFDVAWGVDLEEGIWRSGAAYHAALMRGDIGRGWRWWWASGRRTTRRWWRRRTRLNRFFDSS